MLEHIIEFVLASFLAAIGWWIVGSNGGPEWAEAMTAWLTFGIARIQFRQK